MGKGEEDLKVEGGTRWRVKRKKDREKLQIITRSKREGRGKRIRNNYEWINKKKREEMLVCKKVRIKIEKFDN